MTKLINEENIDFDNLELDNVKEAINLLFTDIEELSDGELSLLLLCEKPIMSYLSDLGKEAYSRILQGKKVQGWKLVGKKTNRVWIHTDEKMIPILSNYFGENNIWNMKLKSPAQLEKLGKEGKSFVKTYGYQPEPKGFSLAKETDTRERVEVENLTIDEIEELLELEK